MAKGEDVVEYLGKTFFFCLIAEFNCLTVLIFVFCEEVTAALDRAAGYLRSQIARDSSLRTVPKLTFKFDESVGRGRHMEALLGLAKSSDAHNQGNPEVDET